MTVDDQPGDHDVARLLVDTSVLLAATDVARLVHSDALRLLDEDRRALVVTPQILREYLAVATRPIEQNGLGQEGSDAVANLGELLEVLDVVEEDHESADRLTLLVSEGLATGKQIHDANVVAVALARGISTIATDTVRHFARYAHLIAVEPLAADPEQP